MNLMNMGTWCLLSVQSSSWAKIRRVVGGRLVNGYSAKDLVLSVVYRYRAGWFIQCLGSCRVLTWVSAIALCRYERYKFSVAGLGPVQVAGVQNVDLSDMVTQVTHPRRTS